MLHHRIFHQLNLIFYNSLVSFLMTQNKRLQKELADIQEEKEVSATVVEGDLTHWRGYINGPKGTPYEGGHFIINIKIPSDYPYNPPKMKFDTKIWHPNVSSQTGAICLDILKSEWSPALTLRTALLSIQALMSSPEPDDPQDAEVASMYKTKRKLFEQTAKYWTETFASPQKEKESNDDKVRKICEIGFSGREARLALQKHNWDETSALNSLLGG
eukprot:Filipodium_phascolosomae@DN1804_c0_g2_i1.p1